MDQIAWSGRSATVCEPPERLRTPIGGAWTTGRSPWSRLFVAVGDASSGEVVRGEFDLDFVARKNSDVVAAHLSGDVPQHGMPIFEFDPEHGVRERLDDGAFQHDCIFFRLCDDRLTLFGG